MKFAFGSRKLRSLCIVLTLAAGTSQDIRGQGSSATDEQRVIAAAERLFTAIRAKDGNALRALLHDHARLLSVRANGDIAGRSKDEWIRGIVSSSGPIDERIRQPEVRIDGNLATLWTPYTFRRGDKVSHCGTNAFQYVRNAGEWRLIAAAFTTQTTGCEAGPGLAP